jgi:hypothetical protein
VRARHFIVLSWVSCWFLMVVVVVVICCVVDEGYFSLFILFAQEFLVLIPFYLVLLVCLIEDLTQIYLHLLMLFFSFIVAGIRYRDYY